MAFYSRGDEVDDFDEYDPTPYGGGYDIALTYGRPLEPSEEICHPISSSSSSSAYSSSSFDRYHYSGETEPYAYGEEAQKTEYSSYTRPKPPPATNYSDQFSSGDYGYAAEPPKPQPNYGFQPGIIRPGYGEDEPGSGYGDQDQPRRRPEAGYGYGYGEEPLRRRPEKEYGYVGGRSEDERPSYNEPPRRPSNYGEQGGVEEQFQKPSYGRPSYETKEEDYGYEKPSYARKEEDYGYQKPSYARKEEDYGYEKPSYARKEEDYGYQKPDYEDEPRRYGESYGEQSSGRKKYGDNTGDEEKKHSHHHHHHHRKYLDNE